MTFKASVLAALLPLTVYSSMIHAAENPLTYDRINLSASAQGKAANDVQVAVLFYRSEGPAAEPLASEVNKAISAAIDLCKKVPEVAVQTLDYQTFPTYQNQKVTGWSVQQSIRLESKDTAKLGQLIGDLQNHLKVESISYQISPEAQRLIEDRLMGEALKAFQQRADLVTRELGRQRYRLVAVDVNTNNNAIQPFRPMAMAKGMAMDAQAAAPAIEAGEQTVTVTAQGTIELQPD